jgi:hypothetical protein
MWILGLVAGVITVVGSALWAVYRFRVGARDALDLVVKLAVPYPSQVADWPELRLDAVVLDPETTQRVLVLARWPARPEGRVLLMLDLDDPVRRGRRRLLSWRAADASVSPRAGSDDTLMLRRRHTNAVVTARVVRETPCRWEVVSRQWR